MKFRTVKQMSEAMEGLETKIWYDRHQMLMQMEKTAKKKTPPDIIKGAIKAAKEAEKKYGKKNLGPHTDFDWGMLNGKLSALRWVFGEDWDMLDT